METALLDNYPEVLTTLSCQQKPHLHCYVLVDKGKRWSFLGENGITDILQSIKVETVRNQLRLPC